MRIVQLALTINDRLKEVSLGGFLFPRAKKRADIRSSRTITPPIDATTGIRTLFFFFFSSVVFGHEAVSQRFGFCPTLF